MSSSIPYGLIASVPLFVVAALGLALTSRVPRDRRGLTVTAMVLFLLHAVVEMGLSIRVLISVTAGTPLLAMVLSILLTTVLMVAFVLLIIAACRRPRVPAPLVSPAGPAPAGPFPPPGVPWQPGPHRGPTPPPSSPPPAG
ncbi:hypothetical protein ACFOVU_29060 [Nocardiopsis sediminis]|uniref:Uncharacterized protein n=1 Tax=Nocardiopsis sediminis TaxID=1778267 RepID=A0ABV8FV91_9ACTN